ncbi:MAG: (d)CMP kinase [Candidatus Eiseniibacteriota bacterium]|nr:MAG: (d)CMP kinase [Candidatus Eisenbacteria bacterium]
MTSSGRKLVIAIDGPSASGKSTTARMVAERLRYLHVDTGAMYRALALKALRAKLDLGDDGSVRYLLESSSVDFQAAGASSRVLLDGQDVTEEIRKGEVSQKSSEIAALPAVRRWMVRRQRALGQAGGVVMEGRDIGTVVLPDADLKVYLDASSDERAKRRWLEEGGDGSGRPTAEVRRQLDERDHRDMTRSHSPLEAAADAVTIDTTHLSVEEQVGKVLEEVKRILESASEGTP